MCKCYSFFGQTFSALIMMYSNMRYCDVIVAQLAMNMLCVHYPVFLYSMRREIIYLFRLGCTLAYQIWAHTAMFLHGSRYSYLHFLSQGGMTALMVVSYTGHSSVVRALLQAGPAINTTNQVRYSACQTLPQCGFYLQWNCVYKGQGDRLEWHLKENPPYSFVCGKLQVHIDVL